MLHPSFNLTNRGRGPRIHWSITILVGLVGMLFASSSYALSEVGIDAPPRSDNDLTCYEIAAEITRLSSIPRGTPGFWGRGNNQVASVMSVISPVPAVAYLGFSAYRSLQQDETSALARGRIAELRRHSAMRQCFVR